MQRLGVDRSTVYRMALDGRLPAVKVGRQWRFPESQIDSLLSVSPASTAPAATPTWSSQSVQALLEVTAARLGVMMLVTDMAGRPVTEPVNPCPWFVEHLADRRMIEVCAQDWRRRAGDPLLQPEFVTGVLGFDCAHAFVREGNELVAMVLAGGIAPAGTTLPGLYSLDDAGRQAVVDTLPRVAAALSGAALPTPSLESSRNHEESS